MNLLIISPGFFENDIGGVATVVRHMALGLMDRGYEVAVFTTPNSLYRRSGKWQGIRYWQFPFRYRSVLNDWARSLSVVRQLRPQAINVHYPIGGRAIIACLLHLRTGAPMISSLHFQEVCHPNLLERGVATVTLRLSRYATANSRYLAEGASAAIQREIVPIYNGVVVEKSRKTNEEKMSYVAAAGSLVPQKHFATLIRSFHRIARLRPEVDLKIAGEGYQETELRRLVQALGLERRVKFLGHLGRLEVRTLFARALVVVVPSYCEGFGLVALEAMAEGTPVVVAGTGGLPEIVRNGVDGVYVDPRDMEGLSTAIDRFLVDSELRSRLGSNAQERAVEFTWDRTVEGFMNVFDASLRGQ